jgi:hypothetical protein
MFLNFDGKPCNFERIGYYEQMLAGKVEGCRRDLQTWVYRHQEVLRVKPEITKIVIEARDKAFV